MVRGIIVNWWLLNRFLVEERFLVSGSEIQNFSLFLRWLRRARAVLPDGKEYWCVRSSDDILIALKSSVGFSRQKAFSQGKNIFNRGSNWFGNGKNRFVPTTHRRADKS